MTEYVVGKLAKEFKGLRCDQQFSRDIIMLLNDNGTSQAKQIQSSSTTFITFQDLCLRQELLVYMSVHDNVAFESSQPSWGKRLPSTSTSTSLLLIYCSTYASSSMKLHH
ncbi:hypothetical protein Tco_0984096, partial [Tanacetum coccineum]